MLTDESMSLRRRSFLATLTSVPLAAAATATITTTDGLHDWGMAPEFRGITQWLNTPALTMADMRGKVVLIDFWTYACINCLRTLPHINRWAETYRDQGLVVVGVHTPEFAFERSASNVQSAIKRHKVKHPVAMDNTYATWKAYDNSYWPSHYLVDGLGRIRYRHFGEGAYDRTEAAIRTLLAKPNRA